MANGLALEGLGRGAIAGLQMFRQNERQDAADQRAQGLYDQRAEAFQQQQGDADFARPYKRKALQAQQQKIENEQAEYEKMMGARDALAQIQTTGNFGAVNDYMHSLGHTDFLLTPTDRPDVFEMQHDGEKDMVTRGETTMFMLSRGFPKEYAKSQMNKKDQYGDIITVDGVKGQYNTTTGEFKPFPRSATGSGSTTELAKNMALLKRLFPNSSNRDNLEFLKLSGYNPAQARQKVMTTLMSQNEKRFGSDKMTSEQLTDQADKIMSYIQQGMPQVPGSNQSQAVGLPASGQQPAQQPQVGLGAVQPTLPAGGGVNSIQAQSAAPVNITSPDQFAELPTGTKFIYQGQLRVKN